MNQALGLVDSAAPQANAAACETRE